MLVFDGDYPMAHGGLLLQRDLTLPIEAVRGAKAGPGRSLPEDAWENKETEIHIFSAAVFGEK